MLYIMRHGQTEWNVLRKLQGRTDIPLNEEGRKMARQAAVECRDTHFDVCYCSPLCRAKETAELVLAGRDVPIYFDERLMELGFGEYEGVENGYSDLSLPVSRLFHDPEAYVAEGGAESLDELFARTGEFLKEVIEPELKQGKDVLIMGHGAMNSGIICQVRKLPRSEYLKSVVPNCKLIRLI